MKYFIRNVFGLFFLTIFYLGALSASSAIATVDKDIDTPEFRINLNGDLTSGSGCVFHVEGWIEISVGLGGVNVKGYDFTVTSSCLTGPQHFVQNPFVSVGSEGSLPTEQQLHDTILAIIEGH